MYRVNFELEMGDVSVTCDTESYETFEEAERVANAMRGSTDKVILAIETNHPVFGWIDIEQVETATIQHRLRESDREGN